MLHWHELTESMAGAMWGPFRKVQINVTNKICCVGFNENECQWIVCQKHVHWTVLVLVVSKMSQVSHLKTCFKIKTLTLNYFPMPALWTLLNVKLTHALCHFIIFHNMLHFAALVIILRHTFVYIFTDKCFFYNLRVNL